jgi:hypothetical protein
MKVNRDHFDNCRMKIRMPRAIRVEAIIIPWFFFSFDGAGGED